MPMPKVTVPTEREKQILRENLLDPEEYGVTYSDDTKIRLLCYKTRDTIEINKGDRPW